MACTIFLGFTGGSMVKNPPAKQETWVQKIDLLEKEMGTQSSILVWEISWTEEPGGLQCMESQRVGYDLATKQLTTLIVRTYFSFEE